MEQRVLYGLRDLHGCLMGGHIFLFQCNVLELEFVKIPAHGPKLLRLGLIPLCGRLHHGLLEQGQGTVKSLPAGLLTCFPL